MKTYFIAQPFDKAGKLVREAFARNAVNICGELDITSRVERDLQIEFVPCRILLVESTPLLVEAATLEDSAALLFPLHVRITGRGWHTVVDWIEPAVFEQAGLPADTADSFGQLESLVARSLEQIGVRREANEPLAAT